MAPELFNINASKSIKCLHIMQILYIFKNRHIIYIRTQAFAVHTKYYVADFHKK
jgi:hypothetical protein